MQAYRIEATIQPDGKIILENLPFDEGESVEIIVLETKAKSQGEQISLSGTVLKYENPFEPVAGENWEVLK